MNITMEGIEFDCSLIQNIELLDSEIFGHEENSWHRAYCRKIGLLECAAGMNLILLNSGSLPKAIVKRLKCSTFRRKGGNQDILVKAKVVLL